MTKLPIHPAPNLKVPTETARTSLERNSSTGSTGETARRSARTRSSSATGDASSVPTTTGRRPQTPSRLMPNVRQKVVTARAAAPA